MGLMFVLMGTLSVLSALSAFAPPRIRGIEFELPDMLDTQGGAQHVAEALAGVVVPGVEGDMFR